MASGSNRGSRAKGDSDAIEVLKPLLVLTLFGTILYGAYSILQKGPQPPAKQDSGSGLLPPQVEFTPLPVRPAAASPADAATVPPAADPPGGGGMAVSPAALPAVPAPVASDATATFLAAQASAPPLDEPPRPDRYAALPAAAGPLVGQPDPATRPLVATDQPLPLAPSAVFMAAWAEAHDKLGSGRYAEALAALSIWHDDPSLGLEESQRLDDLLGQLAGTVIYSQRDLLLPPHVVAPGETLPAIAGQLAVPWQLLAKINGIDDPQRLQPGEHLKLVRGPFDATVSVSRRRLTLHVGGNYAGRFSVVVGRQFLGRVGGSLAVQEVKRGGGADGRWAIVLDDGLAIEPTDDPAALADAVSPASILASQRDFADLIDILGAGSRVLVRQ